MVGKADDEWSRGDAYEPYVGRWSRLVAPKFLDWLSVPSGRRWLDVGCGTGALTETVLGLAEPASVVGVDRSEAYLQLARNRMEDPRARFIVGDARSLPLPERAFDAVVSGLALNFIPDLASAAAELARVVAAEGVVAAYVWDYAEGMELMRFFWDSVVELDPGARPLDEGVRFPICSPEPLRGLFQGAGLTGVEVKPINVATWFRDFDDYWTPFLGGQGPAPGYTMSLTEQRRDRLRSLIQSRLPVGGDGSIHLTARAWAVRGRSN